MIVRLVCTHLFQHLSSTFSFQLPLHKIKRFIQIYYSIGLDIRTELKMESWIPTSDVAKIVEEVHAALNSEKTHPIEWRKEQLKKMWNMLDDHEVDPKKTAAPQLDNPAILLSSNNEVIRHSAPLYKH
jgi:inorganic triphosphatase YgiF